MRYEEPYNYDLSVIIIGNNEMWMSKTVEDICEHKRGKTEVIAVLDGGVWANPGIKQHPDVKVIFIPTTIGQRAATNVGVRLSKAKYVAKADAHCSFDEGFDVKMLEAFKQEGDNAVIVPVMRNLHAFDWKCYHCGWKKDQGPTPTACGKCGKSDKIRRKMTWDLRKNKFSQAYTFDSIPHFQYHDQYKKTEKYAKDKAETGLTETMGLQGSFFMATREKYWELNLSDESVGSWGNQGIEVACKMWLSGGRVLCNHNTWYAHMFRTQGGDFTFPYDQSGNAVQKTKQKVWEHFFNGKFKQQIHPMSWLVERFMDGSIKGRDSKQRSTEGTGEQCLIDYWNEESLKALKEKEKVV